MLLTVFFLFLVAVSEISAIQSLTKRDSYYHLNNQIAELRHEMKEMKIQLYKSKRTIAFTAFMGRTGQSIYYKGQTFRYPHYHYNIGKGYNTRTGQFRCPEAGTYVFFFTSMPERGSSHAIWLNLNGKFVVEAVSGKIKKGYNMGSNMVVLYLKKGDMVWIRASKRWPVNSTLKFKYAGNTFSGFRIS